MKINLKFRTSETAGNAFNFKACNDHHEIVYNFLSQCSFKAKHLAVLNRYTSNHKLFPNMKLNSLAPQLYLLQ